MEGLRMAIDVVALGHGKEPQHVNRMAFEMTVIGHRQPAAIETETIEIAPAQADRGDAGGKTQEWFTDVARLDRRTKSARQAADRFGGQEVVLHQPLDTAGAGMVAIAKQLGDFRLNVEIELLLGATAEVMQLAAQGPIEALGLVETLGINFAEQMLRRHLHGAAEAIEKTAEPAQGLQVAQSTFAVLDIGLQRIT